VNSKFHKLFKIKRIIQGINIKKQIGKKYSSDNQFPQFKRKSPEHSHFISDGNIV